MPRHWKQRKHKYGAIRTTTEHGSFPSKGEAKRYGELLLLQQAGQISGLERQIPFALDVNGIRICKYIADFQYVENGQTIIEDFKGKITPDFKLKYALMFACHNILIRLTGTKKALKIKRAAA